METKRYIVLKPHGAGMQPKCVVELPIHDHHTTHLLLHGIIAEKPVRKRRTRRKSNAHQL